MRVHPEHETTHLVLTVALTRDLTDSRVLNIYYLGAGRLRTPTAGETMYSANGGGAYSGGYKGTGDSKGLRMSRVVGAHLKSGHSSAHEKPAGVGFGLA